VKTSHPPPSFARASIATTMACEPKRQAASSTRSGFSTAEVLMLTLSAPAFKSFLTSSTRRTPPPTVSGMNTWSATRPITSTIVSRASLEAVMSRKVSSSAPASS
jgi:hypothetical protein